MPEQRYVTLAYVNDKVRRPGGQERDTCMNVTHCGMNERVRVCADVCGWNGNG